MNRICWRHASAVCRRASLGGAIAALVLPLAAVQAPAAAQDARPGWERGPAQHFGDTPFADPDRFDTTRHRHLGQFGDTSWVGPMYHPGSPLWDQPRGAVDDRDRFDTARFQDRGMRFDDPFRPRAEHDRGLRYDDPFRRDVEDRPRADAPRFDERLFDDRRARQEERFDDRRFRDDERFEARRFDDRRFDEPRFRQDDRFEARRWEQEGPRFQDPRFQRDERLDDRRFEERHRQDDPIVRRQERYDDRRWQDAQRFDTRRDVGDGDDETRWWDPSTWFGTSEAGDRQEQARRARETGVLGGEMRYHRGGQPFFGEEHYTPQWYTEDSDFARWYGRN